MYTQNTSASTLSLFKYCVSCVTHPHIYTRFCYWWISSSILHGVLLGWKASGWVKAWMSCIMNIITIGPPASMSNWGGGWWETRNLLFLALGSDVLNNNIIPDVNGFSHQSLLSAPDDRRKSLSSHMLRILRHVHIHNSPVIGLVKYALLK